ncbi:hypothetical protein [Gymnodinialimonas sp.]
MTRQRRTLWLGLVILITGLGWTLWAWSVQLAEMHLSASERTRTLLEVAMIFNTAGLLAIIASRFIREDP